MRFATALAFTDPLDYSEIAVATEAAGWDYLSVADHIMFPDKLESPYPYVEGGKPFWPLDAPWPDPWVAIGAMSAVTKRLRFLTNVFVLPARSPLLVAKSVGTAAVLSRNRVSLGIGVGWMREEFDIVGQDFSTRGKRANEMIEILRGLWNGGRAEFHGDHYDFDTVSMYPAPTEPVPILVGGVSGPALRRAARYGDGWISVAHTRDELADLLPKLHAARKAAGTADRPFEIVASCKDVNTLDGYRYLRDLGVTCLMTFPWMHYGAKGKLGSGTKEQKIEGIRRFAEDFIEPLRA